MARGGTEPTARFLHRELVLLVVLAVAGSGVFWLTRTFAASNAAVRRQDAAAWHAAGVAGLHAGDTKGAVQALQRAEHIDRTNRDIALSLAQALRASGADDQASMVLTRLRELRPEDIQVNVELARLEAHRGNPSVAVRYYQDALNGLWAPDSADRRRELRLELVSVLLAEGERARALAQTIVLASDLPPDPSWQLRVARLFLDAGSARRAFDAFSAVLVKNPNQPDALAGAGEAAFALGDYSRARRYLSALESPTQSQAQLRTVADLVLTVDPLAVRLSGAERNRRLQQILQHAEARLEACAASSSPELGELREALTAFTTPVRRTRQADARDRAENGLDLALRIEQGTASCVDSDALSRAIGILGRLHGLMEQR
ncbi:MAG: tetratricopeptide repeat protein [Vicinamibacterales bacterium]